MRRRIRSVLADLSNLDQHRVVNAAYSFMQADAGEELDRLIESYQEPTDLARRQRHVAAFGVRGPVPNERCWSRPAVRVWLARSRWRRVPPACGFSLGFSSATGLHAAGDPRRGTMPRARCCAAASPRSVVPGRVAVEGSHALERRQRRDEVPDLAPGHVSLLRDRGNRPAPRHVADGSPRGAPAEFPRSSAARLSARVPPAVPRSRRPRTRAARADQECGDPCEQAKRAS
jgi:hypothetical protein